MSRVLRLTLLAPEMVEAILDGRHGPEFTIARLLRPFPEEWARQELVLAPHLSGGSAPISAKKRTPATAPKWTLTVQLGEVWDAPEAGSAREREADVQSSIAELLLPKLDGKARHPYSHPLSKKYQCWPRIVVAPHWAGIYDP